MLSNKQLLVIAVINSIISSFFFGYDTGRSDFSFSYVSMGLLYVEFASALITYGLIWWDMKDGDG